MTDQSANMKLSRIPGKKPQKALLAFDQLSWNIVDGVLYAKGLDEFGNEKIFVVGGKFLDNIEKSGGGRQIELRAEETIIQWRYVAFPGEDEFKWEDLIKLSDLHPTGYENIDVPENKEISRLLVSNKGHLAGIETRLKPAGTAGGPKIVVLTQTDFDQLNPPEHDTLYFIKDYILKEL